MKYLNIEIKDYNALTEKQKRFIDYYIETANATESAKRAGYSSKTAKSIGAENLSKLDFFITTKLKEKENQRIASQDEVLQYLTKVMRGEEKDTLGLCSSLHDRIKCAELLCKQYGTFKEKSETFAQIKVELVDDITE